ncbi:hypothetical protein [Pseudonocardia sp.]|uniref:hypothetical protein n=1 Tax=Pseudonocardia sp. TaxID=60912 RepID=UPI002601C6A9|nr:hypothetical protein [Pseudonocardia sp.]
MSRVKLNITEPLILEHLLRLGKDAMLVGATVEHAGPMRTLVLEVHLPNAPEGATEAMPTYKRVSDVPDPVQLTGVTWFKDGQLIAVDRPEEGTR